MAHYYCVLFYIFSIYFFSIFIVICSLLVEKFPMRSVYSDIFDDASQLSRRYSNNKKNGNTNE